MTNARNAVPGEVMLVAQKMLSFLRKARSPVVPRACWTKMRRAPS